MILDAISKALGGTALVSRGSRTLSGVALTDCIARALLCTISNHISHGGNSSMFDSNWVPAIPLCDYVRTLQQNLGCSDAVFVCAMAILDRVLGNNATAA